MEFGFGAEERAFASEVRAFLQEHPPADFPVDGMDAGYGSGAVSRAFLRSLGERGWLSMTWPREHGGQGRPIVYQLLLLEELARAGAPFGPLEGCDQTAHEIIRHGSPRLRQELLPRIARGDATFWQGFSEPGAGSDLLALTSEATRDGADWIVRGHKIWSSHADYGLVLARTSRESRRSRGLSMFVVDNRTPGLDVRPIRSLTGQVYHYEVFLDAVRVPADYLLGTEGQGFVQLLAGLDTDRFWARFYKAPSLRRVLDQLVRYANETVRDGRPLARDPAVRRQLATFALDIEALRLFFHRTGWMLQNGLPTPHESALGKVYADETGQALAAFGMDLLGLWGPLTPGSRWAKLGGELQHLYQVTLGHTIAGGTSEILRTSVATRGLGLPAEPRPRS
jgi:alkylation response protein AidB-like acyl-CoA dehydrogenase